MAHPRVDRQALAQLNLALDHAPLAHRGHVLVRSAVSERRVIQSSLARLTGEDPGNYARDWLEWWDEHGSAWTPEEKPRTGDRR